MGAGTKCSWQRGSGRGGRLEQSWQRRPPVSPMRMSPFPGTVRDAISLPPAGPRRSHLGLERQLVAVCLRIPPDVWGSRASPPSWWDELIFLSNPLYHPLLPSWAWLSSWILSQACGGASLLPILGTPSISHDDITGLLPPLALTLLSWARCWLQVPTRNRQQRGRWGCRLGPGSQHTGRKTRIKPPV